MDECHSREVKPHVAACDGGEALSAHVLHRYVRLEVTMSMRNYERVVFLPRLSQGDFLALCASADVVLGKPQ